jgi:hypothetical protein
MLREAFEFPPLSRGMIDLKDLKCGGPRWLPVGKGVEAGAKEHVLTDTILD